MEFHKFASHYVFSLLKLQFKYNLNTLFSPKYLVFCDLIHDKQKQKYV